MATEKELRSNVASWLNQYKGIKEGSAEHEAILAVFNDSGLCSRYKMSTKDAWCAAATSAAFIACDLADIFPCVECSCSKMITLAKNAKIWVEDDSYTPNIGDCVLYDWDDSGSGDNTGTPDHVGIVQSVSGSAFTVIEGNKDDTVGVRDMKVNGKYIRGFIAPDYASKASSKSNTATFTAGDKVTLSKAALYESSTAKSKSGTKSGTFYIWDASVKNSRIRVTNTKSGVGKDGKVTGWVNVSDIGGASTSTSSLAGTYKVTPAKGLNIRKDAGVAKAKIIAIPKGTKVECDGSYKTSGGVKWLYVTFKYNGTSYAGYGCSTYLTKC